MSREQHTESGRNGFVAGERHASRSQLSRLKPYALGIAAMTTACAAGAQYHTLPRRYDCGAIVITATHGALIVNGADASLVLQGRDADH